MMWTVFQLFQSRENFRSHKVETLYNHTSSLLIRFSAPSFLWGQLAITVKLQKLKSWCPRPLSLPPFLSLILKIPETYLAWIETFSYEYTKWGTERKAQIKPIYTNLSDICFSENRSHGQNLSLSRNSLNLNLCAHCIQLHRTEADRVLTRRSDFLSGLAIL